MNVNIKYEKFTQRLYATLTRIYPDIEVMHNGKIMGNQIDVYWYATIAGIKHLTIIECKNFTSDVTLGEYRNLAHNMDEIKARGVLVTTKGFQSGVVEKAMKRGDMTLLIVNFQESEGPTLEFNTVMRSDIRWYFDKETTTPQQWEILSKYFDSDQAHQLMIYCSDGELGGFDDLVERLPLSGEDNNGVIQFDISDTYLRLPTNGAVRISRVSYRLKRLTPGNLPGSVTLRATTVTAHVKDVLNGDTYSVVLDDIF
jgi:hypothetical protein